MMFFQYFFLFCCEVLKKYQTKKNNYIFLGAFLSGLNNLYPHDENLMFIEYLLFMFVFKLNKYYDSYNANALIKTQTFIYVKTMKMHFFYFARQI